MKAALRVLGSIAFGLALFSGFYGIWLAATPDRDGGRQAVGLMMTAFAVAMVVIGTGFVWASVRFRRRV